MEYIYGITDLVSGEVSAFVRFKSDQDACSFCRLLCRSSCLCDDLSHLISRDEVVSHVRDAALIRYGEFGIVGDDTYPTLVPCTPIIVTHLSPVVSAEWDCLAKGGFPVIVSRETSEGVDSCET